MNVKEAPVVFECDGDRLVGVLHSSDSSKTIGVVFVVGGPQYRVGSHRQFVLMAREIAATGMTVFRFDYRGMGDSSGKPRTFEFIDADIETAVDTLLSHFPGLKKVLLLGLCDAASASLIYAPKDPRIQGLILINPWVRTIQGEAEAYLKHYYLRRFFQASFWRKISRREFDILPSIVGFLEVFRDAIFKSILKSASHDKGKMLFIDKMLDGFRRFRDPILIVTSGHDLTAKEFIELTKRSVHWGNTCSRDNVEHVELPSADHTFSKREQLDFATNTCTSWLREKVNKDAHQS